MKKKALIIGTILLVIISMTNSIAQENGFKYQDELRIGLRQHYENQSSIRFNNSSLLIGYSMDGTYVVDHEVLTIGTFQFEPCVRRFLISVNYYTTYQAALEQVTVIRSLGHDAFVGSVASGIWKIYVGYTNDEASINQLYNNLNGINGITYEVVSDNGKRTMVFFNESYPIIFENTNQQVQFATNNTKSGVPVIDMGIRSYRGRIEIGRIGGSGITAINIVEVDDYLYGVLPGEMPADWPIEALKSQAVAARSYGIYHAFVQPKFSDKPYHMDDTINSQVYKGYGFEDQRTNSAIDNTAGKLIYYNDEAIPAYFFSTSGGHTESSVNVWSGNVVYLQGKPDIYETSPYKEPWTMSFTGSDFTSKLEQNSIYIGDLKSVDVKTDAVSDRVYAMTFNGTLSSYTVEKETIRYWFGFYSRKFDLLPPGYVPNTSVTVMGKNKTLETQNLSQVYVIDGTNTVKQLDMNQDEVISMSQTNIHSTPIIYGQNGKYILVGQGNGHGVGMSQSGAKGMALEGFTYKEILEYYYTGVQVK